jgi:hypothetical protein
MSPNQILAISFLWISLAIISPITQVIVLLSTKQSFTSPFALTLLITDITAIAILSFFTFKRGK